MTDASSTITSTSTARPSPERDLEPRIAEMLANDDELAIPHPTLTPREACPVFQIGAQLGRLTAEHHRHDSGSARLEPGSEKADHEHIMRRAQCGIDLLQIASTYQRATSLEGALAHVVVAHAFALDISENPSLDDETRIENIARVCRCLHSIGSVLSAAAGLSPRVFGSDYVMPAWSDELGVAWSMPRASYVVPGDKPTVDDAPVTITAEAIIAAWAASASEPDYPDTPDGNAASDAAGDRRDELLKGAERLPATRSNLLVKALALAWIEYVDQWSENKLRNAYTTDGRLALDIHVIVTAEA